MTKEEEVARALLVKFITYCRDHNILACAFVGMIKGDDGDMTNVEVLGDIAAPNIMTAHELVAKSMAGITKVLEREMFPKETIN